MSPTAENDLGVQRPTLLVIEHAEIDQLEPHVSSLVQHVIVHVTIARFLGTLPSIRLGHYVRFKAEEIHRFVAERSKQAA